MKVSVFGLGYVGAVSCGCLAKDGAEVVGVDVNPDKVQLINEGRTPIVEALIVPLAVASSRYRSVNSWSRMTINLPFSKIGIAMGDPIYVPADASPEVLDTYRRQVEAALNATTAKAYALAGADMTRATPVPKLRPSLPSTPKS